MLSINRFPVLALSGSLFLSGCSPSIRQPSLENHPSEPAQPPSEALINFEKGCRADQNHRCSLSESRRLAGEWFQSLSRTSSNREDVQPIKPLSDSPLSLFRFLGQTASFVETVEAHGDVSQAFLKIDMNLEYHPDHPILLLRDYLKERGTVMADPEGSEFLQMATTYLPWLDSILVCNFEEHHLARVQPQNCNETNLRESMALFQSQILADGIVSRFESEFALELAKRWEGHTEAGGALAGYLILLGYSSSWEGDILKGASLVIKDERLGSVGFLINHGIGVSDEEEEEIRREASRNARPDQAEFWYAMQEGEARRNGFETVPDLSQTPLRNRKVTQGCFEAALCGAEEGGICSEGGSTLAEEKLDHDYRMISLENEKAQPGDVLVYLTPTTSPYFKLDSVALTVEGGKKIYLKALHTSTVTQVDAQGKPTRAIGKMGLGGRIWEHDADKVYTFYGPLVAVFREK